MAATILPRTRLYSDAMRADAARMGTTGERLAYLRTGEAAGDLGPLEFELPRRGGQIRPTLTLRQLNFRVREKFDPQFPGSGQFGRKS